MKRKIVTIGGIALLVSISSLIGLHVYLLDGLDGWFFSSGDTPFEEDTVYAPGYSDKAFRQIKKGMSRQEVLNVLGRPLGESWYYENIDNREIRVWFEGNDEVSYVSVYNSKAPFTTIQEGMKKDRVLRILGNPTKESWGYSKSPGDKSFRIRTIILRNNIVVEKIHEFYID